MGTVFSTYRNTWSITPPLSLKKHHYRNQKIDINFASTMSSYESCRNFVYEEQRITATRYLFTGMNLANFDVLSQQQRLLCDYIISYTTYQKRIVCGSIFTGMAKSFSIRSMKSYIKRTEKEPNQTLLQHLRYDSVLIIDKMKQYGAERREYDMLGEMFIALLKRDVVPLDLFSQRAVDVQFWLDIPPPAKREDYM